MFMITLVFVIVEGIHRIMPRRLDGQVDGDYMYDFVR
jgi:hypothetical protein